MTNRKNKDKRERNEEESSQIRTRKVQFTGGGFAFPTPETPAAAKKTDGKRKVSGRDAIIVEGRPGQANIKKQEIPAPETAAIPEKSPAQKSGQKKNTKKKTADKAAAPVKTESTAEPAAVPVKDVKQSGGKKKKNNTKAAAPVKPEATAEPAAVPEKAAKQSGGKKKKNNVKADAPVKPEATAEPAAVPEKAAKQSGGKKKSQAKAAALPAEPKTTEATAVLPPERSSSTDRKSSRSGGNNGNPAKGSGSNSNSKNNGNNNKKKKTDSTSRQQTAPTPAPEPVKEPAPAPAVPQEEAQETMKPRNNSRSQGRRNEKNSRRTARTQPKDHKPARDRAADTVLECRFSYSGRGFGFAVPVEPEQGVGEDIFIAPRASMGAMSGDLVQVRVFRHPGNGHSAEGEVTAVTERTVEAVTGRLTVADDWAAVKPDNEKLRVLIYVPVEDCEMIGARDGDKVEVIPDGEPYFTRTRSITIQRRKQGKFDEVPFFDTKGRITTLFGNAAGREANYAAILHSSGIRTEFPAYVLQAAENAAAQPLSAAGRVDLRDRVIFTIDGADAKDLDDAVSLTKNADGDWVLGVHIADVSHYASYDSCVEKEARVRGTSVYFVDKVIPMLPQSLSNGACSLNAGCDKYALSCEITLTPDGQRKRVEIYKSILRSTVRGVYSEVNDLFENGDASPFREKYDAVYAMLTEMRSLYRVLRDKAAGRGVMELEDAEARILLNEEGFPVEIVRRERGDGEKLIEQFMLQANMGVAETLRAKALPCLYRIHEEPDKDKIRAFAVYAHNLGLPTFGLTAESSDTDSGAGLSEKLMGILAEANKKEIGDIVSSVLLRSMMKAKYVAEPKPHFGLGAETYCHFTSPIRRYPDLFVHSVLTAVLPYTPDGRLTADTELPPEAMPQTLAMAAPERGVSSTDTEINAQQAEWKIEDLYMALYMSDKIGQVFDVTVVSVMKFGLFVQCDNLVEGLIPAPLFDNAVVNEAFCTLRAGGTLYTLGTKMQARLVEADPANGRITFAPLEDK